MYYKKNTTNVYDGEHISSSVAFDKKKKRKGKKEMCAFQQRENTMIFVETIRYLAVINGHTIQKPILMHHR